LKFADAAVHGFWDDLLDKGNSSLECGELPVDGRAALLATFSVRYRVLLYPGMPESGQFSEPNTSLVHY
jgi:hypothetical protein